MSVYMYIYSHIDQTSKCINTNQKELYCTFCTIYLVCRYVINSITDNRLDNFYNGIVNVFIVHTHSLSAVVMDARLTNYFTDLYLAYSEALL